MNRKGFTFIELVIILAMVGILIAAFMPQIKRLMGIREKYSSAEIKMIPKKDACSFCVEEINRRS